MSFEFGFKNVKFKPKSGCTVLFVLSSESEKRLTILIRTRILILLAIAIQGCSFGSIAKTAIEFEDGQKVENCTDYNRLRETLFVEESVNNMVIQSEYLDCSLASLAGNIDNVSFILDSIAKNMLIRSIPTSLGPSTEDSDTLAMTGFKVSLAQQAVEYVEDDHNLVITLKGRISDDTYLIWVTDEILKSTYRAYYPAKIRIDNNGDVTPSPYYKSGY